MPRLKLTMRLLVLRRLPELFDTPKYCDKLLRNGVKLEILFRSYTLSVILMTMTMTMAMTITDMCYIDFDIALHELHHSQRSCP